MPKQSSESDVIESRSKQREDSNRATFDALMTKKRAEQEVVIKMSEDEEISMLFQALSTVEYDKLMSDHPPTVSQKADGMIYNEHSFGPALLSKVCVEPQMSLKQWKEVWNSDEWSKGEMAELFIIAGRLCNRGLDIPKSAQD